MEKLLYNNMNESFENGKYDSALMYRYSGL